MGKATGRPRGRPSGAKNKRPTELQAAVEASGETPLNYMLRRMRDPKLEHDTRDKMAVAVAPYVHPKLAAHTVDGSLTVKHEHTLDELE